LLGVDMLLDKIRLFAEEFFFWEAELKACEVDLFSIIGLFRELYII